MPPYDPQFVQQLLQRNAALDNPPDPTQFSSQQMPNLQGPNLPVPVPAEQQTQKPGGLRRFLGGMLAGAADAAMKYSTGMNSMERQAEQQRILFQQQQQQLTQQQIQYGPAEHQARIDAMTAQPRLDPDTGKYVGNFTDASWAKYMVAVKNAQGKSANQAPQVKLGNQYLEQLKNGDTTGAGETLKQLQALSVANKPASSASPSMARWIATVNDPASTQQDKDIAARNIKLLQGLQIQQQDARGRSYAYNRGLYSWQVITDPDTGVVRPAQGWEIQQYQKSGNQVTASGRLSAKDQLAVQQLSSEAAPAIEKVRSNISAYDNSNDKIIFARVIHDAGIPRYGQESGWMGNVLNQALKEGLSPEGQALVRNLSRLNETVGRFRTIMGAPSTDTQMALAMAMLPGPSTPNSAYAEEQLKNFEQMVKLGVEVPILKGSGGKSGKSSVNDLVNKYK